MQDAFLQQLHIYSWLKVHAVLDAVKQNITIVLLESVGVHSFYL